MTKPIESSYPITFRESDAKVLGEHLAHHNSVAIIGMKRVGISNFLRFFLHHPDIERAYIQNGMPHLFIPIDLHDLVEREMYPFWTLTLKRIVDTIENTTLDPASKDQARRYFTESIQLHDLFFTVDSIQKVLSLIARHHMYPTLFFIRFDRLKDAFTHEAFDNLQGLKDVIHGQVSFVFTSYRPLEELVPTVFKPSSLSVFCHSMNICPVATQDMKTILKTFTNRYNLSLPPKLSEALIRWSGGHVQYLHLSLIRLREEPSIPDDLDSILNLLLDDEEIMRQSEELFESLTNPEQETLRVLIRNESKTSNTTIQSSYLTQTGIIQASGKNYRVFNTFLHQYLKQTQQTPLAHKDFTNKEHRLYSILFDHLGDIVEREDIINAVWPESSEMGVSDWAIDRLVSRVRSKLKIQHSPYEITTIITRGFKLIQPSS